MKPWLRRLHPRLRRGTLGLALAAAGACAGDRNAAEGVPAAPPTTEDSIPAATTDTTAGNAALTAAAATVADYLSGAASFDAIELADTVTLLLAPEGGGGRVRLGRDALRDRAAWVIGSGARRYGFVPPAGLTERTVRAGTHFRCREQPLATIAPDLAARPHVGVRLTAPAATSCLETWNATFVFDTAAGSPRLIAALYDQWEW